MVVMDQRYLVRMLIDQICYEQLRQPLAGLTGANPALASAVAGSTTGLPTGASIEKTIKVEDYALIIVAMMKENSASRKDRRRVIVYFLGVPASSRELTTSDVSMRDFGWPTVEFTP